MNPKIIAALALVGAASLTAGGIAITLKAGQAIVTQVDEPKSRNVEGLISLDLDRGEGPRAGKCSGSARYQSDDKQREILHEVPCARLDAFNAVLGAPATRVRMWRELGDPRGDANTDVCNVEFAAPVVGTKHATLPCAAMLGALVEAEITRADEGEWADGGLPMPKHRDYQDRGK